MPKQFVGKVGVKGIWCQKGRVLMIRGENETRWDLPGGRIDVGESATKALVREFAEELGICIIPGEFVHSCQTIHSQDKTNQLFLTFRISAMPPLNFRIPTKEVTEIRWVAYEDLATLQSYQNCISALSAFWNNPY